VTVESNGLDLLRERHGFDEWRNARPTGEALFIWRFFLAGGELPGRHAFRVENVEAPGVSPSIRSIWGTEPEDAEATDAPLFRVDVYEAASRVEARELLLHRLAQFQSPLIERRSEAPGDVAFGTPDDHSLVFSRGNMVVLVLNAGHKVGTVEPVARELDHLFSATPDVQRSPVKPEIRRAEVAVARETAPGAPMPLVLEADDPLGRPVWFRLSAKRGDFFAAQDGVFYTPETEGTHAIEIAVLNENLGSAIQQLEFDV
jgi:hypothetical protein